MNKKNAPFTGYEMLKTVNKNKQLLTSIAAAALVTTQAMAASTESCTHYVKGFIEGALITDSSIVENLSKDPEGPSEFFQRAFKTRVGSRYQSLPPTYYAGFCFAENEQTDDIVSKVSSDYCGQENVVIGSAELFQFLRTQYPCNGEAE